MVTEWDDQEVVVIDPNDAEGFRSPADKPCEISPAEPSAWEPLCAREPNDEEEEGEDLDYLYDDEDDDLDEDLDEDLDDDFDDEDLDEDDDEEEEDF